MPTLLPVFLYSKRAKSLCPKPECHGEHQRKKGSAAAVKA